MDASIRHGFPPTGAGAAPARCRATLGFEVGNDVGCAGMRGTTAGPASQPGS
jgi:hypothetical protein